MTILFLRCGPRSHQFEPFGETLDLPEVPTRKDLRRLDALCDAHLPEDPTPTLDEIAAQPDVAHLSTPGPAPQAPYLAEPLRVVVAGTDAALSAVITRLMRRDSLWVEVGYVPVEESPASVNWAIPVGAVALAHYGTVNPVPLIRNDRSIAVAGSAVIALDAGEIIVDDTPILRGDRDYGARLVPQTDAPGIAAVTLLDASGRTRGLFRSPRVETGRAVQVGGENIMVTVDGVTHPRPVTRATFYRHLRDLQIVRP